MEILDNVEAMGPAIESLGNQLIPRLIAAWAVPFIELATGHGTDGFVVTLSIVSSVLLLFRRSGKGKVARSPVPWHAVWFALVTIMMTQGLCIAMRFAFYYDTDTVYVHGPGGKKHISEHQHDFELEANPKELRFHPTDISVILPCANEPYSFETVKAIHDNTAFHKLKEIIIVDDGGDPPMSKRWTPGLCREYRVKLIRHETTVGLIRAKKTGGDAATGDILIFLDCHVAPQEHWYQSFFELISQNYRRMVVPQIVPLDVDTWGVPHGYLKDVPAVAKCYLTFDGDFKWYESQDPSVAVISGGLVGMSRLWWMQTGGLDSLMLGWGGENLDQSLRSWLCGGEIFHAPQSRIAHMWRKGNDARTQAKYTHVGDSRKNRARAIYGWYGDFADKLAHFPEFQHHMGMQSHKEWVGNLSNFKEVKDRLAGCRPFAWFLRRFKELYEDGGLVPEEIFMLGEKSNGKCLRYQRRAGTSSDGKGTASLEDCDPKDHRFFWHVANRDPRNKGKCCSSLKAWNTDQCISGASNGVVHTSVCDVSGKRSNQDWAINNGRLENRGNKGPKGCIGAEKLDDGVHQNGELGYFPCRNLHELSTWQLLNRTMPLEAQLYRKDQREFPEVFGSLGVQKKALAATPVPQACITPENQNATCVLIFSTDGTNRCLDEGGLLTEATKYCSQYQLLGMCPTCPKDGPVQGIRSVVTGRCFDSMDDHSSETWDLEACKEDDVSQMFTRKGSEVCLSDRSKDGGTGCFKFKPITPQAAVIT